MSVSILVACPFGTDPGLVSKAVELAQGGDIHLLLPADEQLAAARSGAGHLHLLPPAFSCPDDHALARWLAQRIPQWNCSIVLAPATIRMRSVMPILARLLNAGLTADCTALSLSGERLIQTRPAFGNSLMADIRTLSPIQMATVRPGTFPVRPQTSNVHSVTKETFDVPGRIKQFSFTPFPAEAPLSQADIVLAGGLGVGSAAGFEQLEKLAKKLGAAVAASRGAVDAGFAPFRCQVGMTGVTVCPKLYVAVGISGAVQHLAGMSGSTTVAAINTDPKAPIFNYADYGIVGDWQVVIEQLLEEVL